MVLEMLMESLFAVADIYWISHLKIADAVATVSLTESLLTFMYAIAIGLSIGAAAMVARRIGQKDPQGAARAAVQALVLGILVSLVFAAIGVPLAPKLLALMGGSPWVLEHGVGFTRVMLAGNATIAMRVLWLANGINILLGPCFIFGIGPFPKMGVVGAAVATNIGRGIGA